jgi:hypothetical protein
MDFNKLWRMIEEYAMRAQDEGYSRALADERRTAVETYISKCQEPRVAKLRQMAHDLREHNAWRRGEGKYDSPLDENGNEVVGPSAPAPIAPKELGELLEAAATALEEAAE